jgi:cytochrome c553
MRAIAATLSEQDMADLAAYYASGQAQSAAK